MGRSVIWWKSRGDFEESIIILLTRQRNRQNYKHGRLTSKLGINTWGITKPIRARPQEIREIARARNGDIYSGDQNFACCFAEALPIKRLANALALSNSTLQRYLARNSAGRKQVLFWAARGSKLTTISVGAKI